MLKKGTRIKLTTEANKELEGTLDRELAPGGTAQIVSGHKKWILRMNPDGTPFHTFGHRVEVLDAPQLQAPTQETAQQKAARKEEWRIQELRNEVEELRALVRDVGRVVLPDEPDLPLVFGKEVALLRERLMPRIELLQGLSCRIVVAPSREALLLHMVKLHSLRDIAGGRLYAAAGSIRLFVQKALDAG